MVDVLDRLGAARLEDLSILHTVEAHIARVLDACDGSRTVAAKALGMHRRTLQRVLSRGARSLAGVGSSGRGDRLRPPTRQGEFSMPGRTLEERISRVVAEAAQRITDIVRADLAAEVQRVIAARSLSSRNGHGTGAAGRAGKRAARNAPPHCVFPGCSNAHKGPRFSFLCAEHMGISKAEKKKHLDAWKAEHKPATRGKRASTKANGKNAARPGQRGALDEATMTRVLKVIEDHPGLRSEQLYKKLPFSHKLAKKALAKLREGKRVKTTGEKRSMTYATA